MMAFLRQACGAALGLLGIAPSLWASTFAPCETALRANTHGRAAAECFWKAGSAPERREEAVRRLHDAQRQHPESGWLTFYLAEIQSGQQPAARIALYQSATAKFLRSSDSVGEAESRMGVGELLFSSGRREEAWAEGSRLLAAARRSGDPHLTARAMLYEADLSQDTGERLARSLRLLQEAHGLVFPDGPFNLQRRVLGGLGKLSFDLGRYEDARLHYGALMELGLRHGDRALATRASYASLAARRKQMEELPEPERLPELVAAARHLLGLATSTGDPRLQSMANRTLGDLLWPLAEARDAARTHYRESLVQARKSGHDSELTAASLILGRVLADTEPVEARRLIDEALARALDSGNATLAAYAWREQMRVAWKTLPRATAIAESMRALAAIEAQRALQTADVSRAAVLGAWTPDYHWLIGALLNSGSPTRADVTLAFEVAERMRARLLLDALVQPERHDTAPAAALARRQLLGEISAVQRRLLDPRVRGADRAAAAAELERLEREEAHARAELASSVRPPDAAMVVASLDRIERALADDEAMLSFSVAVDRDFYGEAGGGSWLFVTTRNGTRVIQVPDRTKLHAMIAVFRGLMEQPGERTPEATASLNHILLEEALQSLPRPVTRLIVVPDGPLHHVPFAALRITPESPPLGSEYEIAVAPSASVWIRLRERRSIEVPGALVVADPALPLALDRGTAAHERGWSVDVQQLGSLSYARAEGRSIASRIGGSRLLLGAAASEGAIKSGELQRFALVHFAAHALVDEAHPERSAVVLSGDGGRDDGLLQAREIADLPLAGRIIVLSACRSATGAVLAGEGVLGLSRSFFEAGARTVVGTLWPIRDDHAALFFDAFYAALAGGRSVGAAMLEARRSAVARGLPQSAWSSLVVIGDASAAVPQAPHARRSSSAALGLVGTIALAGFIAWRRSRRQMRGATL